MIDAFGTCRARVLSLAKKKKKTPPTVSESQIFKIAPIYDSTRTAEVMSEKKNDDIDGSILSLYNAQKWEEIAALSRTIADDLGTCRSSWVLPDTSDLRWINDTVRNYDLSGIASIGCGCGLLEWLLQKYSGKVFEERMTVNAYILWIPCAYMCVFWFLLIKKDLL